MMIFLSALLLGDVNLWVARTFYLSCYNPGCRQLQEANLHLPSQLMTWTINMFSVFCSFLKTLLSMLFPPKLLRLRIST